MKYPYESVKRLIFINFYSDKWDLFNERSAGLLCSYVDKVREKTITVKHENWLSRIKAIPNLTAIKSTIDSDTI